MAAEKIRELDTTELKNKNNDTREQLFRLRFQLGMGQAEGVKKLRELKKERARILTELRNRELHPETAPAPSAKPARGGRRKKEQ